MTPRALLAAAALTIAGCSCATPSETDAGTDSAVLDAPDASAPDTGVDAAGGDAGHEPISALSFPQAVDGVMWAHPGVYASLPLHVALDGDATAVRVTVGTHEVDAVDPEGDRDWIATIPIASDMGVLDVSATAEGPMASTASGTASLHLGTTGVQLTDFDAAGPAATPELHWVGATAASRALVLSFVDQHDAALPRSLWLARLDGAGAALATPVRVALSDAEDTLNARVAFGASHVGVLFQRRGTPYASFFAIADAETGAVTLAPVALDPIDGVGYAGGDLLFDGQAFVGLFRSNTPTGQQLSAFRVDEASGAITGPSVVAMGGMDDDPMGPFTPFGAITLLAVGDAYVASFARSRHDAVLLLSIPKAQVVRFDRTLTPLGEEHAGIAASFRWQYPPRLFASAGGGGLLIWPETDLEDPDPSPAAQFRLDVVRPDGTLDPAHGDGFGLLMPLPPEYRTEPTLDPLASGVGGTLVWTDDRSYRADPTAGRIELFAARFAAADERLSGEVRFPHARFIEETGFPSVARAGTNTIVVWLDEREGSGIVDPRPQVWLETVWY